MIKHKCTYCGGWEEESEENKTEKPTITIKVKPFKDFMGEEITKYDVCSKCTKRVFDYVIGRIGTE